MEPAVATGVGVRLIAGVDKRPAVHGVDAYEHAEEIGALRNLINAQLADRTFGFDAHFAGPRKDLARDEERQNTRYDSIPGQVAAHQKVVVTTITVSDEIGVVFV